MANVERSEDTKARIKTYNGGNGKLLLAGVLKEAQNIIADNDAGLAGQNFGGTHDCG